MNQVTHYNNRYYCNNYGAKETSVISEITCKTCIRSLKAHVRLMAKGLPTPRGSRAGQWVVTFSMVQTAKEAARYFGLVFRIHPTKIRVEEATN